jgi:PIN domain nuclease of toxin-antitoxin system
LKLLLDTHAVLWWFLDDPALSRLADAAIADGDSQVFVSAVSAFEIAIKFRLGKLPRASGLVANFQQMVAAYGFTPLNVSAEHGLAAGTLAINHRDPFDRLLMAQAIVEDLVLVSNERLFEAAGVQRLW